MPLYEHTLIARPDLSAQQAQALADQYGTLVGEQGGTVGKVEYWGLRNLAFRVKKSRKGHYLHLNIDAPSKVVDELERVERINEDVLRYLTVRVEELEDEPSVQMQKKERDERRRRDRERRRDDEEE